MLEGSRERGLGDVLTLARVAQDEGQPPNQGRIGGEELGVEVDRDGCGSGQVHGPSFAQFNTAAGPILATRVWRTVWRTVDRAVMGSRHTGAPGLAARPTMGAIRQSSHSGGEMDAPRSSDFDRFAGWLSILAGIAGINMADRHRTSKWRIDRMSRVIRRSPRALAVFVVTIALMAGPAAVAGAKAGVQLASPIFGLATSTDGSLLVADAGQGIVAIRKGAQTLVAPLPGVDDVGPIGNGSFFALTGGGGGASSAKLWRASNGRVAEFADLGAFEANVNPDGAQIDSNPYKVAVLNGGGALVADAGANDVLFVGPRGAIDWVATLPTEMGSTANAKQLLGCPDVGDPGLAFVCDLPDEIPTEAVATSVVIGPDGAAYVGELRGFPGPLGQSKVWRIQPGTLHAHCGTDPRCSVVANGFTSIVDLNFGPDQTLYVTEIDESSFAAVELGGGGTGGTVNACQWGSFPLRCSVVATGLPMPTATTIGGDGKLYAAIWALVPGLASVVPLR